MKVQRMTPTQIGAVSEHMVAAQLMLASGGRLSPYLPIADDDGIDLMLHDKVTKRTMPIQVKSRTGLDKAAGGTVQFDVRRSTFSEGGYLLAVLFGKGGAEIERAWLIPMVELPSVANARADKYAITPSPKDTSEDRYTAYRCCDLAEVSERLMGPGR
ncbi:MAG: hypothetical protein MI755_04515 [Sphingomonadales bacterium]|nr:hypothetical protein [Sphingomonadales bacterium]